MLHLILKGFFLYAYIFLYLFPNILQHISHNLAAAVNLDFKQHMASKYRGGSRKLRCAVDPEVGWGDDIGLNVYVWQCYNEAGSKRKF